LPVDLTGPTGTILAPALDTVVGLGRTVVVDVSTPDADVARVDVSLDVDGDGTQETVQALSSGPGTYRAIFRNVSGAAASRPVSVAIPDTSGNTSILTTAI